MKVYASHHGKMALVIIAVLVIAMALYLNRAYAHIYNTIGRVGLESSDSVGHYLLPSGYGQNVTASSSPDFVYSALGDSLTAGVGTSNYRQSYPYLLAQDFASQGKNVKLYDRGIPGERSGGLIKDLLPEAVNDNPNIVTLFIGINDIHGLISVKDFQKNYDIILKTLTKQTKAKVYVINLPYLGSPRLVLFPYNYILNWRTMQFNRVIKEEAAKYHVNYIDLYTPTYKSLRNSGSLYAADSFHMSSRGYLFWANIIYANIHF